MEHAIELFVAINYTVTGLSHLLQRRGWVEFFVWLRSKGHTGVFFNGMLSLGFGSLIVAFHNVWTGLPIVVTIIGWANVLKALVIMSAPELGMRSLNRVSVERAGEFPAAGAGLLVLAAVVWYLVITR